MSIAINLTCDENILQQGAGESSKRKRGSLIVENEEFFKRNHGIALFVGMHRLVDRLVHEFKSASGREPKLA